TSAPITRCRRSTAVSRSGWPRRGFAPPRVRGSHTSTPTRRLPRSICAPRCTGRSRAELCELERDRQRVPRPARKTLSLAPPLVLPVEKLTGQVVLFRSGAYDARRRGRGLRSDAQPNARCLSQVTDPIGARPSAGEHVDAAVVETEPDLDRVLFAGATAGRREVGEILIREAFEHLALR